MRAAAAGLSAEQIEHYERDGVAFPVPVLSTAEVVRFRAAWEELKGRLGGPHRSFGLPFLYFRWAHDLATHPAVLDAVESLLGPELLIAGGLVIDKPPHDPGIVTWHQDGTNSGLYQSPTATAWIALSPSTAESGCMRIMAGSQRLPRLPHVDSTREDALLTRSPEVTVEIDESQAVDVVLRPGEMSLHHSHLLHGSGANRSGAPRIGFIVRFATPALETSDIPVVVARGCRGFMHLEALSGPPPEDLDEGLARRAELDRRRREVRPGRGGSHGM